MPRWYAGVTWVVRAFIRCDRECEVAFDFFCAPSTGDAIKAAAAKLLINAKHLVFIR